MSRIFFIILILSIFSTMKLAVGKECYFDPYLQRKRCNFMQPIVPEPIDTTTRDSSSSQYPTQPVADQWKTVCTFNKWSKRQICTSTKQ